MDQRKKNISLLISLGVLTFVSIILSMAIREKVMSISPDLFKLRDPSIVNRVLIESSTNKIDLSFGNGTWRLNDSLEADRNLIDVLFATVHQAIPKRAVAARLRDSIVKRIDSASTRVAFFSGPDVQKEFRVLGDDESGLTYFSEPAKDEPYVMAIPGYRVKVSGIFEQNTDTWRDKRIFNFNWRNFKALTVRFPRDPQQSFEVAMTGRFFSIVNEPRIDTTSLNDYLDAISLMRADRFYTVGESSSVDSLAKSTPIMNLEVKDVADNLYSFKLFEIGKGQMTALCQWEQDFVWIDKRLILQIYKKKKDFVK